MRLNRPMVDSLPDLKLETYKALYATEEGRRDHIRASLAVPVAAMTFSMVGFGVFANNFAWQSDGLVSTIVSILAGAGALISAGCLMSGMFRLYQADRLGAKTHAGLPSLGELTRYADERKRQLTPPPAGKAETQIAAEVKDYLIEYYYSAYADCAKSNLGVLSKRHSALIWLLIAIAFLLVSIVSIGFNKCTHPNSATPAEASSSKARPNPDRRTQGEHDGGPADAVMKPMGID